MSEDLIRYDVLIESALREVVHQAMAKVVKDGLPGEHHFYITFLTHADGVEIPDYLKEQYSDEMTIVLQHQFYGLTLSETGFDVTLSFNNVRERLHIPFAAITTFADPSVNFALQFQPFTTEDVEETQTEKTTDSGLPEGQAASDEKHGEVISLDSFRKK